MTLQLLLAALVVAASPAGPAQQQRHPPASRANPPVLALALQTPVRAAFTSGGDLLVTDSKLKRVCRVAPDRAHAVDGFPVLGSPTALGVLGARVFVGNETARRVEIYSLAGQLQGTLGGAGFEVGDPRDLEIDAQANRLYVVDGVAKHVKVFDLTTPEGLFVASIGAPGSVFGTFQNPTGIALDPVAHEVLVGDYGPMNATLPPRVLVFGYDGAYKSSISGDGGPTGQYFARPQGMLVGASGHLFLVDCWRGEVIVMDRATGTQVGVLGAYGEGPGQLFLPLDLAVYGPNRDLYVTSASSHRVEVFANGGQL